ncbi:hypothetical protein vseg_001227 [Gypsophila vaccaria]
MKMCHTNDDDSQLHSPSPSTDEETSSGLMLASDYPKKRAGRKKFKETRHPIYRGVRQRSSGKWVSEVRQPNKKDRIWLGTFLTADMAARAHDVAVLALRGTHGACLNFADSVWRLPVPASSDTKDIQRAATQAADAFRPSAVAVVAAAPLGETIDDVAFEFGGDYVDDDMVFGMTGLIADMYQGLAMSPPRGNYCYDHEYDRVNEGADVSLWSYSF